MPNQYAYYYPEGPGYLFVSYLGQGHQGCACLVRSVADGKLYVRKSTSLSRWGPASLDREVSNSLKHPNIPQCVDMPSYEALGPDKLHDTIATYWEFKNGGDLRELIRTYRDAGKPVPEMLMLKATSQVLDAATQLRKSGIAHRDILPCNVFVHWPSPYSALPDFYLGDLGRSERYEEYLLQHDGELSEVDETWRRIASHDLASDIASVTGLFKKLALGASSELVEVGHGRYLPKISSDLLQAANELRSPCDLSRAENMIAAIQARIQKTMNSYTSDTPSWSEEIIRPSAPPSSTPILYAQPSDIEHAKYAPPGPWQIAAVDPLTLEKRAILTPVYHGGSAHVSKSAGRRHVSDQEIREKSGFCHFGRRSSSNSSSSSAASSDNSSNSGHSDDTATTPERQSHGGVGGGGSAKLSTRGSGSSEASSSTGSYRSARSYNVSY